MPTRQRVRLVKIKEQYVGINESMSHGYTLE